MNFGNARVRSIMNVHRSFEISVYFSDFLCFKAVLLRRLYKKKERKCLKIKTYLKKASLCFIAVFNLLSMLLISIHNFEIWLRKFV